MWLKIPTGIQLTTLYYLCCFRTVEITYTYACIYVYVDKVGEGKTKSFEHAVFQIVIDWNHFKTKVIKRNNNVVSPTHGLVEQN